MLKASINGHTERGGKTVYECLCGSKFQILAARKKKMKKNPNKRKPGKHTIKEDN